MKKNKTVVDETFLASLQRVLVGMPAHTYCKDLNGIYLACNDGLAKTLGYPSGDCIVGKTDFDLSWRNNATQMQKHDQGVIRTGQTLREEEIATLPDGSTMTYLSHKMPYRDDEGNIIGVLGMSFDINTLLTHDLCDKKSEEAYCNARVLLVEDNRIAQRTIMLALGDLGCHAVVVGSGREAIQAFSNDTFNLIYMDIGLPDMEGYEVVKAIRACEGGQKTPASIVVLTAHICDETERKCIESGADGILRKPLTGLQSKQVIDKFVLKKNVDIDGFKSKAALLTAVKVIDAQAAAKSVGISEALVRELLQTLIDSLPDVLHTVQQAKDAQQLEAMFDEIHKFHGGLHYVGVPKLEHATSILERALISKNLIAVDDAYRLFLDEANVLMNIYEGCHGEDKIT